MEKNDENISDNSLNKSVARSSSGVSTQQSAEGIDIKDSADCQIVYGNCFSRFPHPEIKGDEIRRYSTIHLDDSIICGEHNINTVERKSSLKFLSNKTRRSSSDCQNRTLAKLKHSDSKRKNDVADQLQQTEIINNLRSTISGLQDNKSPSFYNATNNSFFRNPSIPQPTGNNQEIIQSESPTNESTEWTSFEAALHSRAELHPKELMFAVIDPTNGKVPSQWTLSYHKLERRAQRLCYHMTLGSSTSNNLHLRPGQSVALMFNVLGQSASYSLPDTQQSPGAVASDAEANMDFLVALYACLMAKVIAVPIDTRFTLKELSSGSSMMIIGEYLTRLSISVVLTNNASLKELNRLSRLGATDFRDNLPWSEINWVPIENLYHDKLPKNFQSPEPCGSFIPPIYIEYEYCESTNEIRGLPISNDAQLTHCSSLGSCLGYSVAKSNGSVTAGAPCLESILITDDIRRGPGLWHTAFMAMYYGLSVYYMPTNYIKKSPNIWLTAVSKLKIQNVVTSSRVLHHSLGAEPKQLAWLNLSLLQRLIITDASVPWINETLDRFLGKLGSHLPKLRGNKQDNATEKYLDVISCVSTSRNLTICCSKFAGNNRPYVELCGESLSYGLIKLFDSTNQNASFDDDDASGQMADSLKLQSSGLLISGMRAAVIKLPPMVQQSSKYDPRSSMQSLKNSQQEVQHQMCNEEELGEICVASTFSSRVYWMSPDEISDNKLKVNLSNEDSEAFTRTGLVGFFRRVDDQYHLWIYGSLDKFLPCHGRIFNSDDLVATVAAVKPQQLLYKARCCIFTVPMLHNDHMVISMEIDTSAAGSSTTTTSKLLVGSNARIYSWIASILQAILSIHKVNVYCVCGLPPNSYPKSFSGDIYTALTRHKFLNNTLPISHLTLCPHTALPNLPRAPSLSGQNGDGPPNASISMLAHALHSNQFAQIQGGLSSKDSVSTTSISGADQVRIMALPEILEWRAVNTPDHPILSVIGVKSNNAPPITCEMLHRKAQRVASYIRDKMKPQFINGSTVTIMVNNPVEELYALYGCFYAGVQPLVLYLDCVAPQDPQFIFVYREICWAVKQAKSPLGLASSALVKLIKSKDCTGILPLSSWLPQLVDIADAVKYRSTSSGGPSPSSSAVAGSMALAALHVEIPGPAAHPPALICVQQWTHFCIGQLSAALKSFNQLSPQSSVAMAFAPERHTDTQQRILITFLQSMAALYCGFHCFVIQDLLQADVALDFIIDNNISHTFCDAKSLKNLVCSMKTYNTDPKKKLRRQSTTPTPSGRDDESLTATSAGFSPQLMLCVKDRPPQHLVRDTLNTLERRPLLKFKLNIALECWLYPAPVIQTPIDSYPHSVCLDRIALRHQRITETIDTAGLEVTCVGLPVSESCSIIVVDAVNKCQKSSDQLGELWILSGTVPELTNGHSSPQKISQSFAGPVLALAGSVHSHLEQLYRADATASLDQLNLNESQTSSSANQNYAGERLAARLSLGQSIQQTFYRTRLMGFIRSFGSDQHLVVLGKLDEMIQLRGLTYFPQDLETAIVSFDSRFISRCVVFTEADLLVVIVQLTKLANQFTQANVTAAQQQLVDQCLRFVPSLVSHIIQQFQLPPAIIQFVSYSSNQPASQPTISSVMSHNQRRLIRTLWLNKRLDSILQFYCL